jgi:hypothetical protein
VDAFRAAAFRVYLPWDQPIGKKAHLRWLKSCAPNGRARGGMRKVEQNLLRERRHARKRMMCGTPGCNRRLARYKLRERGELDQWSCLDALWVHESDWDEEAWNLKGSGAGGIPQALPASKMGPDADPNVGGGQAASAQIDWGLDYIEERYGSPCGAWSWWLANGWY